MKIRDGKIWDAVRGRWLVLTPEEWVRQSIIKHLTQNHKVEPHRIGREVLLSRGQRADLVIYDRMGQPLMIIECKAESVALTQEVVDQVARYNTAMGIVPYLAITNGRELFCCQFDSQNNEYTFISEIPEFL